MVFDAWQNKLPVTRLCDLVSVSRDAYYHLKEVKTSSKKIATQKYCLPPGQLQRYFPVTAIAVQYMS